MPQLNFDHVAKKLYYGLKNLRTKISDYVIALFFRPFPQKFTINLPKNKNRDQYLDHFAIHILNGVA